MIDERLLKVSETTALVKASKSQQHKSNIQKLLMKTEIECSTLKIQADWTSEVIPVRWPVVRVFAPAIVKGIVFGTSGKITIHPKDEELGKAIVVAEDRQTVALYANSVFKACTEDDIEKLYKIEQREGDPKKLFVDVPCQILQAKNLDEEYFMYPLKIRFAKGFFTKYAEMIGASSLEEAKDLVINKIIP